MKHNNVIFLTETDSTNSFIKDLCKNGKTEEGTVVCADFQTAGRGQKGNVWESEAEKNLLFSMVLYPQHIEANSQFILSQIVSVAIKNVLSKYTDNISIKWPNDIYWNNKKICGLLIENDLMDSFITRSIVGIGLNVNQQQFVSAAPNPVSLWQILHADVDREVLLKELIDEIGLLYRKAKDEATAIIADYKTNLYRKDGFYSYSDGRDIFKAKINEIESSGILVLETDEGLLRKFAFKEVSFI